MRVQTDNCIVAITAEQERQGIINTLCSIDPNGEWRDGDGDSEPLTLEEARQALVDLYRD